MYKKKVILVTGANGQLGNEMRLVSKDSANQYLFTDVAELDITDLEAVRKIMKENKVDVVVNCAAYTNVDKAEDDEATARRINRDAVENLAVSCMENGATLIHVSTDYVFPGNACIPCTEDMLAFLARRICRLIPWVFTERRSWKGRRQSKRWVAMP